MTFCNNCDNYDMKYLQRHKRWWGKVCQPVYFASNLGDNSKLIIVEDTCRGPRLEGITVEGREREREEEEDDKLIKGK